MRTTKVRSVHSSITRLSAPPSNFLAKGTGNGIRCSLDLPSLCHPSTIPRISLGHPKGPCQFVSLIQCASGDWLVLHGRALEHPKSNVVEGHQFFLPNHARDPKLSLDFYMTTYTHKTYSFENRAGIGILYIQRQSSPWVTCPSVFSLS